MKRAIAVITAATFAAVGMSGVTMTHADAGTSATVAKTSASSTAVAAKRAKTKGTGYVSMRTKHGVVVRGPVYFGNRTVTWNVKVTQPKGYSTNLDTDLLNADGTMVSPQPVTFYTNKQRKTINGKLGSRRGGYPGLSVCLVIFNPKFELVDLPCSADVKPR